MHIVIVTTLHPICDVRILYREARSLARAGYDVEVIGPPPGPESDVGLDGIRLTLIPRMTRRERRFAWEAVRLFPLLVRRRADVYHLHDPELLGVGFLLRLLGRTVVFDLHEDLPLQILSKDWIPRPLRRAVSWASTRLLRFAARRFDGWVAATETVAKRVPARCRPVVVRNYPVLDLMPPSTSAPTERKKRLVYVGGITRDRGAIEMLEAMRLLDRDDVELVLIGTASEDVRRGLEGAVAHCRTQWLPWQPPLQVYERLAEADVGLVCLHPLPRYVDALPVKLFEYMAAGLPVIASDFPGFREIVEGEDCGLLVDPLDPLQIAEAAASLLDDPDERRRLGENGRRAVKQRYNWGLEEIGLLELYARLAARKPSA